MLTSIRPIAFKSEIIRPRSLPADDDEDKPRTQGEEWNSEGEGKTVKGNWIKDRRMSRVHVHVPGHRIDWTPTTEATLTSLDTCSIWRLVIDHRSGKFIG